MAIALSTTAAPNAVLAASDYARTSLRTQAEQNISISNFQKVNDNLYRGGRPSFSDLQDLKAAGVKTILNLRMDGDGEESEAQNVQQLGMKYVNEEFAFGKPDLRKVERVLNVMNDPANFPVYIHCRQGADRTGMMVGIYRVLNDGWSWDQVWDEMKGHHFKFFLTAMKNTVKQFSTGELVYNRTTGIQEGTRQVSARADREF